MDKNSKKRSHEIIPKDKLLVNTKVFVANSRSSNLSSPTSSSHSRPIQTKISKLTIYEPQPDSPAKFTVKSVHTRMNHDYQPEELVNKNINQSFKPRNINLKEFSQDTAAEYEKKKLERRSDCQNIKSLLNEIQQNHLESNYKIQESNEILLTPKNNIKTNNSHRSNPGDKPSFISKQILSAIAAETENQNLNNLAEDNLKVNVSENLSVTSTKNLLQKEMEPTKLETVLENTYQNKIINYGTKQKQQFCLTNPIENNELSRSKTDILVTERSDFMQISPPKTVRSQSSINLNSDCISDRKKSYNPEEARRFMQEQKKKRKLTLMQNATGELGKNPNDKEAIKKRLEDLRKNSLKILQRSVKIAKKKDGTPLQQYLEVPSTSTTRNINGQMVMTRASNQREEEKVLRPQNSKPPPVQNSARIQKSNSLEIKNDKIGLLRKETDDNSFSALNDKENVVSNTACVNPTTEILQKITDTLNRKGSAENVLPDYEAERVRTHFDNNKNEKQHVDNQHPMEYSNMYESLKKNPHNLLKPSISEEIDLKVPDVKLNSKILLSEKSVQCGSTEKPLNKQNSLPYWLKPSPIQIYPYNFIMAVRKKLEAITNPTLATNDDYKHIRTENNPKNTPVSHLAKNKVQVRRLIVSNKVEESEKSRDSSNSQVSASYSSDANKVSQQKLKDNELLECVVSAPAIIKERPVREKKTYKFSKSSTDTTSNFSSMSIHIPKTKKNVSNRLLSSTKIDGKNDDTTISSSVFSSPEKKPLRNIKTKSEKNKELSVNEKPLSPLSVENISNLRIKSKYLSDGINMDRGDNIVSNNIHIDPMIEMDFNQFLSDFNQSLSQVIEVNQQLKVTLDKSNKIFSQNQQTAKKKDKNTDEYTSDFEEETVETVSNTIDYNNFVSTATNHSSIPESTIVKADVENLNKDQPIAKVSQSNYHDRNKNLERHSTDSEIVEIITSDTLSRTISVSLKSSKDFTQTSKNEISEIVKNGNSPSPSINDTIKKDINSFNSSSQGSESDNHSIEIIHRKEIENYSMKSNNVLESITSSLNQNKDINNLEAQHIDIIPEELNKTPTNTVKEKKPTKYDESDAKKKIINTSASSEFVAAFNQSDFDFPQHSESNLSESTLNYSSIGLYEQLLQNENRKTEQLAAFLRMREKVILDRAKGQIAWLEVQREKIRSKKNLNSEETLQLIGLKKRQRGILLKMEKERDEIQKLLQNQIEPQSSQTRPAKLRSHPKLSEKISDVTIRKSVTTNNISNTSRISTSIVRGFELQGDTQKLEEILKRREEELKKRREYAERLMEWHQRLDREENEVLLIEKTLYNSNFNQISSESHQTATPNLSKNYVKRIKKLKEIDKSLRKIQNISNENENHKEISGSRLNKLWNRLTGRNDEKFIPDKEYDINKYDLEKLYEEAKDIVSSDFNNDEFLEQFRLNRSGNTSSESQLFKLNQTVNGNNKNNFEDVFADATKSLIKQDELKQSSNELTFTEADSEKSNKISENKSNAGSTEHLSDYIKNDVNNENQFALKELEPVLDPNEVQLEENQPSIESLRPSVIVLLQKSQEDLCLMNETSNEILDEISIETKISKGSTNASQMNSEDLGGINSALSITSESGIFNNSYENINENSNLNEESTFNSNQVIDSNKILTEPLEIISDISGKSSVESIRGTSVNSTDIAESINSKNTDQSSDFVPDDTENEQIMFNNEDAEYENELFESDTLIEDISSPKFESTLDESKDQVNEHSKSIAEEILENLENNKLNSNEEISNADKTLSNENKSQSELEKRLIDIDDSLKDLTDVFEHALSPDKSLSPPLVNSNGKLIKSPSLNDFNISSMKSNIPIKNFTTQSGEGSSISGAATQKMPDIISEAEVRRRQIFIENEMKQLEQTIPYYFNREIPNKPPPPYHSPAHGSPMTIIFPSENRIKEITFKRTEELYVEIIKNDNIDEASNARNSSENAKNNLAFDENITNIYERIVLDICQEYITECKKTLIDSNPETYKNSLALFNPPDKLKCLQEYIYKNVRKSLGMDKVQQQTHQHNLLKNNSLCLIGKNNKRDNVDDILIEELYEEESKWLNFDIEEEQVKNAIVDEILNDIIKDVIDEVVDETMKLKHEKF